MSIGRGAGENRAVQAAEKAIGNTLLDVSIDGAKGILINVRGGNDLGIHEVKEAADIIRKTADPEANIIFGAAIDPDMDDEIQITVIATGFDPRPVERPEKSGGAPVGGSRLPKPPTFDVKPFSAQVPSKWETDDDEDDVPEFIRKYRNK